MTTVTILAAARFTGEIRGRRAVQVLKRAGVPHLYDYRPPSGRDACWTFPLNRVDDVLAAAETVRGISAVIEQETLL